MLVLIRQGLFVQVKDYEREHADGGCSQWVARVDYVSRRGVEQLGSSLGS